MLYKQKSSDRYDKRKGFRNFLNAVLVLILALTSLFSNCAGSEATSGVSVGPLRVIPLAVLLPAF